MWFSFSYIVNCITMKCVIWLFTTQEIIKEHNTLSNMHMVQHLYQIMHKTHLKYQILMEKTLKYVHTRLWFKFYFRFIRVDGVNKHNVPRNNFAPWLTFFWWKCVINTVINCWSTKNYDVGQVSNAKMVLSFVIHTWHNIVNWYLPSLETGKEIIQSYSLAQQTYFCAFNLTRFCLPAKPMCTQILNENV